MSIAALSSAAFSQYVASSSNINASQQALQSLGNSLSAGNLTAAQTAFINYQALTQNLANASGTATSSQFSKDLTALGTAISSGDVAASQSAFATLQTDARSTVSPAIAAALAAAAQTVSDIEDLLSIFSKSPASSTSNDPLVSLLSSAYGQNASSSATDPTVALLEQQYGTSAANAVTGTSITPDSTTSLLQLQYGSQAAKAAISTPAASGVNLYV